jgi:hypothetical protein
LLSILKFLIYIGIKSNYCIELSDYPISSSKFFGRTEELTQISHFLNSTGEDQKRLVLWALPGFGKTRIALRYVELHKNQYKATIWIDASTYDTAVESFSQAAVSIRERNLLHGPSLPPVPARDKQDIIFVKRWLEKGLKNWLMIVDSSDELEEFDARQFLPKCNHGAILITSSRSGLAKAWDTESIEVSEIDSDGGVELLLSYSSAEVLSNEGMCSHSKMLVRSANTQRRSPFGSEESRRRPGLCTIGNRTGGRIPFNRVDRP